MRVSVDIDNELLGRIRALGEDQSWYPRLFNKVPFDPLDPIEPADFLRRLLMVGVAFVEDEIEERQAKLVDCGSRWREQLNALHAHKVEG